MKNTTSKRELNKLVKEAQKTTNKWQDYLSKLLEYQQAVEAGTTPPGERPPKPPRI